LLNVITVLKRHDRTKASYWSLSFTPLRKTISDSSPTSQDSGDRAYLDLEVTEQYIIREFNENVDPIELLWHRDDEDRTIEIIGETNWQVHLDNQLPTSLNQRYIYTTTYVAPYY
jgi:hypothetical protein